VSIPHGSCVGSSHQRLGRVRGIFLQAGVPKRGIRFATVSIECNIVPVAINVKKLLTGILIRRDGPSQTPKN
jgi:hypothetical protein